MSLGERKSEHAGLIMQIQYSASRLNDIKNGIRHTTVKLNLAKNLCNLVNRSRTSDYYYYKWIWKCNAL